MTLALLLTLLAAAGEAPPAAADAPPAAEEAPPAPDSAPAEATTVAPAPEAAPTPATSSEPPQPTSTPAPTPAPTPAALPAAAPAATALATSATPAAQDAPREFKPRLSRPWAIGLSIIPGVAVPGLGHRLSGDDRTANRLLLVSGLSLAGIAAGGAMLMFTTGNHDLSPYGMALLFAGASTWGASWLGDVVGTLRPEGQVQAFHREDSLTAALLYGPSLAHSGNVKHLGILRAEYETERFVLDGWGSLAPGTRYQELHLRGGLKLYGDGKRSHVAVVAEGLRELGGDSDSYAHGVALMVEGRLDAAVIDPSMTGLILLQRLGGGAVAYTYDGSPQTDLQAILVIETGIALALTDWFEVSTLYSQRPDKRLGFIFDHGGHLEFQVRVEVHPKVRLVALTHIGSGMDVMGGVEVAAW